ncbi:DUF2092 domain-containing protein [Streptomyces sp. NPDC005438]|uniref:LolA family protein n=1 Tax=Streptomyces sp. NPDC005438 TaxID=3156880 RepID=UPI0033BDCBF7
MARTHGNESDQAGQGEVGETASRPVRGSVRYGVPAAVAGLAALTLGLGPALADSGDPDLPKISTEKLLAKLAKSDVRSMSGTVKIDTDLGLPQLPGGQRGGGAFGGDQGSGEDGEGSKGSQADPRKKLMELASGSHVLRVAVDGPERHRVSVVEETAEYSAIHNGDELWTYDSASNSAYHVELPEGHGEKKGGDRSGTPRGLEQLTPQEAAKRALAAVDDTTSVSVDGTSRVAGRDAYQLLIKPKESGDSTIGAVRIAVDAQKGVPLQFSVAPRGGGKDIVKAGYTKVDFGKPAKSTFDFSPPKGTKVTEGKVPGELAEKHQKKKEPQRDLDPSGLNLLGQGWDTVVELKGPKGALQGLGSSPGRDAGEGRAGQAEKFLDSLTDKAKGEFGEGRVVGTRVVNVLITDKGKVYAGTVTKEGLVKAANKAAR